ALAASPQFSYFVLEPLETLRCHFDLALWVDSKAQEFPFPHFARSTFVWIDLQLQLLFDPPDDLFHHSLGRLLAAYVDVTIVRIAAKPQFVPSRVIRGSFLTLITTEVLERNRG